MSAAAGSTSFTCSLPSGATGPYRLLVYNGNPDGTARASSAVIRVNGVEVLGERSFNQQIQAATARLSLASVNTIDSVVNDVAGLVRVEVVDEGQTCSILKPTDVTAAGFAASVASPNAFPIPELQLFNGGLDGSSPTNKGRVLLDSGVVVGRDQIRTNVTAVLAPLTLAQSNALSAGAGEKGFFSVQIVDRDETAPRFWLSAPPDGSFTNQAQLTFSGTVDDPSATLTANGSAISSNGGTFTGQVALKECWNAVTVTAADPCGNASAATVRVGLDTVPPVLGLLSPPNGLVTNGQAQAVTLRYSDNFSGVDPSSVRLLLDGNDVTGVLSIGADSATGTLSLNEGRHNLHAQVSDRAGNLGAQDSTVVVDLTPPVLAIVAPADGSNLNQSAVAATITYSDALSGVAPSSLAITRDGQDVTRSFAAGPVSASATFNLAVGTHQLVAQIADLAGNVARTSSSFTVRGSGGGLPPDPKTVAPPTDPTVATDIASATAFLYSGSNPIQTGVADGTIEARRVAVIRGQVKGRDGNPIGGVTVTILNHPELGQTLTRSDGMFDLAVNGGGLLTVNYQKDGFLPAQRQVQTPWRDYVWIDEVVLVRFDTTVNIITDSAATTQVARGSVVTDENGTRQATLVFLPATRASMTLPDGTTQQLAAMHIRATEYTVGPLGPRAMPGVLPPTSGYTYAVELSVDEAVIAGAEDVQFSNPVAFYVENFLGFPAGGIVPVGYYDRRIAAWVPSKNGRVISIVGITGGVADLDVDGDGLADDATKLLPLGVTDAERSRIAGLYAPGTSLWRVSITHLTPWDCNWPVTCTDLNHDGRADCEAPNQPPPNPPIPQPGPCIENGSSIECENQVLGEKVGVVGTPYSLHYTSARVPDRAAERTVKIPITESSVPFALKRIEVTISIAGQIEQRSFSNLPGQRWTFIWDGKDGYGRALSGTHSAKIQLGYVYGLAQVVPDADPAFAYPSSSVTVLRFAQNELTIPQRFDVPLTTWAGPDRMLGSWGLDVHHTYDPSGRRVYFGTGETRAADGSHGIIRTIAGKSYYYPGTRLGDDGPALEAALGAPRAVAIAPDGSVAFVDDNRVRRIKNGVIETLAGNGTSGFNGDGIPATEAKLGWWVGGIAFGPDGLLYIADSANNRIRKIDQQGLISTVAGVGTQGFAGDGGPAVEASLFSPHLVAFAADGTLFIGDDRNARIRRVTRDGIISTFAGSGECVAGSGVTIKYSGDGGPATAARMGPAGGMAVTTDGALVFTDRFNHRIRRVGPDGIITTIAGDGKYGTPNDGNLAINSSISYPEFLAIAPDGSLFVTTVDGVLRRIDTAGIISTVGGGGGTFGGIGWTPDGSLMLGAKLNVKGMAFGPDGLLYYTEQASLSLDYYVYQFNPVVRRLEPPLPEGTTGEIAIPSQDATQLYVFDSAGRHLRSLDARTGAVLYSFGYEGGLLSTIQDASGNVTRLERDGEGYPTAIVAPHGQRMALRHDANGRFSQISNPAGDTASFEYTEGGLMRTFTDPRGRVHRFSYDGPGRLVGDENPSGGSKTLARTERSGSYDVSVTTALGRTRFYSVEGMGTDTTRRVMASPDGSSRSTVSSPSGSTTILPDGTVFASTERTDPRFGMEAPVSSIIVRTPGGRSLTVVENRSAMLTDPANPLSVTTLSHQLTVNGRANTTTYTAATLTSTATTPAGRTGTSVLDAKGKVVRLQTAGVLPVQFQYDSNGRLIASTQGARTYRISYDAQGYPQTLTDPLWRTVSFTYDPAGRVLTQVAPGRRSTAFGYDASGNLTSVTPPGRPAHGFGYTPIDLMASYTPPLASNTGLLGTQYSYDVDGALAQTLLPDQSAIVPAYDFAGRLSAVTTSRGTTALGYDAAGRVGTVTAPDGGLLTYAYDGSLTTSETTSGTFNGTVAWTYDNDFRVASTSVNGASISYQYDADSLLTGAGALTVARDAATGRISGTTLGAATTSQGYNEYGELASLSASASGSSVYSYSFTRDLAGRITGKTETVQGVTDSYAYGYDEAGRLATVSKNGHQTASYLYDDNGNRLSKTTDQGTESGSYDDQDRMYVYGGASYAYRPNGELASKSVGGQTTLYDYDSLGNLRAAILPNGRYVEYAIDGLNRRVGKKVNGALAEGFLYEGQLRPVAWLNGSGQVYARFVYGTRVNVPEYMVVGSTTYRFITDHLGSPRLIVNASTGAVIQRIDYDEWGNVLADSNPGFQPFGFAGGLYERDTGLVRFGARDYDPQAGRWTSKDPEGLEGGLNVYEYCGNNPVNLVDPLGLDWTDWDLQPYVDFLTGVADAASLGLGPMARSAWDALLDDNLSQMVDECSGAYEAGQLASLALGAGRAAYAGIVKGGAMLASSGAAASAFRSGVKSVFRLGLFRGFRAPDLLKYATDDALRAAAGRTNPLINSIGFDLGIGATAGAGRCKCR